MVLPASAKFNLCRSCTGSPAILVAPVVQYGILKCNTMEPKCESIEVSFLASMNTLFPTT